MKTPFNVLRHISRDQAPRMPQAVGAAILGAIGVTAGATVTYVVGYIAVSAITSVVLKALAPKPPSGTSSAGILANVMDPAAPHEYVYGKIRKGGVRTYIESTGDTNKYLHMIIALAGHEVAGIDEIYINDEIVTLDANGLVTDAKWNSKIRIKKHLGDQTTVDADLLAESNQITADFVGNGIAYLYVRLEYDQDTFANGIPLFTATTRGRKVFDPRTSTTGYSANAALAVRDYLTADFGLNDPAIDEASFAASANVSDETISLAGGGSEPRYEINGIITADMNPRQVMERMMTASNGTLFWGQGAFQLHVAYYSAPIKTFTLDDLRGAISLDTRASARDNFNRVTGTFIDAAAGYISSDYPPLESPTFLAEDYGVQNTLDLQLPMTTSAAAAQRLAKLILFRAREQMTITAEFGMAAFGVQVGDIVAFTNPRYGWTAKEFEVAGWKFDTGQDGAPTINLTLRETSAAAFAWNAEELEIIRNNTTLPNFTSVAQLSNLTLTTTALINDDGITIPAIRADWDVSLNSFVEYYEIQYKRLGGEEDYGFVNVANDTQEDWGSITVAASETEDYGLTSDAILTPDASYTSVIGTSNSYTLAPVLNGYDYIIRVRAINSLGVRSPWISTSIASAGDTTPPSEPTFLLATGAYKSVNISWNNPADLDLSYVEIYANTTNNLGTATPVGTSASTNFTHYGLENNVTRYYWVRAVDYSLNKSPFTASVSATTLLIAPNDFNDAVNDLFTEAGAFGIQPVSTLPATGAFDGQLVLLLPDITIYRWDAATAAWSTDIYTASSLEAGAITYASFATGIEPVGVVDTLPTVTGYVGPQVVVLTTDGKLYRLVSGAWTAAVNTADIDGTIGANLFSDDLRPIERVASLPVTALTQGRMVFLTTDNKLYRYTGTAWTAAVPATDVTGQINGTQIADAAITATKLGDAAITAAKVATGAITSTKLGTGSVTATAIADAAVTAGKIGDAAVTTTKLANAAVNESILAAGAVTATKIADGSITTPKIVAGAVTASEIAAGSITTAKIVAGAVTASEIAAGSITSDKIVAAAITTGKIAASAITATEIATDAITTDKIAAGAVTASEITAGAITTAKIAAGAVTATEIATGAITAGKVAASAITADAIAANAVTSAKITAGAVTANELAANAVIASKISAGAVSADAIAANAITATKIAADAVTAGKIAANAVDANAITANAITTAKIAAGAVNAAQIAADAVVADKIFAGAVTADKIATDAITANKIAASSIISSKIATGAVTANKISVAELSAISANLGTIVVDNAHIADGAITNAKIGTAAITSAKIGDLQVDTLKIAGNAVTTFRGLSGSVSLAQANTSYVVSSLSFAPSIGDGKILMVGSAIGGAQSTSDNITNVSIFAYWRGNLITSDKIITVPSNQNQSGKIYFNAVFDAGGLSAGSFVVYGYRDGGHSGSVSCDVALTEFKR